MKNRALRPVFSFLMPAPDISPHGASRSAGSASGS